MTNRTGDMLTDAAAAAIANPPVAPLREDRLLDAIRSARVLADHLVHGEPDVTAEDIHNILTAALEDRT